MNKERRKTPMLGINAVVSCRNNVLEMSTGIHDMGGVRWQLLLCLFIGWVFVFLCLIKGVKTSGKVWMSFGGWGEGAGF